MRDLIINFAPTGMVPTKQHTPHIPVTVDEIVAEVIDAYRQGISMVHLHTRHASTGLGEINPETYADIILRIRQDAPDLVICVSLSGRSVADPCSRAAPLLLTGDAKPDMASLTLSSLNFINQESVNSPATIQYLAKTMQDQNIMPELEVFDLGMINYFHYLRAKHLIVPPFYCNVMFGNIAGLQASPLQFGAVSATLSDDVIWSAGGIGQFQLVANAMAIATGQGVRIGLEDMIWFDRDRTQLATNRQLIGRVIHFAKLMERPLATPRTVRKLLALQPGNGCYGR